jgi:hypothetical protein
MIDQGSKRAIWLQPLRPRARASLSTMEWTRAALVLGLAGCGLLGLKIGESCFEHKRGVPKSVGAAATLTGLIRLIAALAMI